MYFYIDESGQTGLSLFDSSQPSLFYGVLSSRINLDVVAESDLRPLRERLGVQRLHANHLGNGKLVQIKDDLVRIKKKFDLKFDLYRIAKPDHALISFFDQTFDQGLNPAVPWTAYWTPLRYIILVKLAHLFDRPLLEKAWEARTTTKNENAESLLSDVCKEIVGRVGELPDARSREIISDGLTWVINNPSEIGYNVDSKKDALQISPNLIGFQLVMHGITSRLRKTNRKAAQVIVDRQSEFNAAQEFITEFYQQAKDIPWATGPGLPKMDLRHIPTIPIKCTPGDNSAGLELVDIYIWIFKRNLEGRELAPDLNRIITDQLHRGQYDEISINALEQRWGRWFEGLPELTDEQQKMANELHEVQEARRAPHIIK